jgi:DNA invertase Pin-like site-specific DNA recombinase
VSTIDQNVGRQLEGLVADKTFTDHASGKNTSRPALQEALAYVREGDTLVVFSMDRLARNVQDLLRIVSDLNRRGVAVEFTKEHLSFDGTATPMAQLMLTVMGAVAQFEREMLLERQKEGVAIAKREGRYKGRAPAIRAGNGKLAELERLHSQNTPVAEMARATNVSRQTIYSWLKARKQPEEVAA